MAAADAKRQEERVKLFATALSNVGVATIVAGFISPLFLGRVHISGAIGALLLGMLLHLLAQVVLHYVVETPTGMAPPEPFSTEAEL